MASFDDFLRALEANIKTLAGQTVASARDLASKQAMAFVQKAQEDLKKWTGQLAAGDITADDFEFLIRSDKDLATMTAIEIAGLSAIQVQKFTDGLLQTIVSTATGTFL